MEITVLHHQLIKVIFKSKSGPYVPPGTGGHTVGKRVGTNSGLLSLSTIHIWGPMSLGCRDRPFCVLQGDLLWRSMGHHLLSRLSGS